MDYTSWSASEPQHCLSPSSCRPEGKHLGQYIKAVDIFEHLVHSLKPGVTYPCLFWTFAGSLRTYALHPLTYPPTAPWGSLGGENWVVASHGSLHETARSVHSKRNHTVTSTPSTLCPTEAEHGCLWEARALLGSWPWPWSWLNAGNAISLWTCPSVQLNTTKFCKSFSAASIQNDSRLSISDHKLVLFLSTLCIMRLLDLENDIMNTCYYYFLLPEEV